MVRVPVKALAAVAAAAAAGATLGFVMDEYQKRRKERGFVEPTEADLFGAAPVEQSGSEPACDMHDNPWHHSGQMIFDQNRTDLIGSTAVCAACGRHVYAVNLHQSWLANGQQGWVCDDCCHECRALWAQAMGEWVVGMMESWADGADEYDDDEEEDPPYGLFE